MKSTRKYKKVQEGTRRQIQTVSLSFFFVLFFTFLYLLLLPPLSFAQSPSPTLSASPTPTQQIMDSAQERLKKAVQEKADEAKKVLDAKQRRALIGKIKDITSSAITIQLKNGSTKMAAITDQTVIMRNGKTAKPNEMAIGDFVIAMGFTDPRDNFDAKRIIGQNTEPESRDAKIIFGTIGKVNLDKKTFSVITNRPAELGGPETIELSPFKTSVDITKINPEDKILVIVTPGKTGQPQVAKAVKIIK
ncbi:MAG: hypothetical protein AAB856_03655 [Patescibacteria group bacterium]